ncbi:MAG: hypothetical protein AB1458_13825 [Bacteroidota bacterium]
MKILASLCCVILIIACVSGNKTGIKNGLPMVSKYDSLKSYKGMEILAAGKIVEEKFVNKGGKELDFTELWLEMDEGHRIMLRQRGKDKAKDYVGKQVKVQGTLFYGNIDSDDPKAQSRVGYRLDYTAISL